MTLFAVIAKFFPSVFFLSIATLYLKIVTLYLTNVTLFHIIATLFLVIAILYFALRSVTLLLLFSQLFFGNGHP